MAENNWVTGVITLLIGVIAPFITIVYTVGARLAWIYFPFALYFCLKVLPSLKL